MQGDALGIRRAAHACRIVDRVQNSTKERSEDAPLDKLAQLTNTNQKD